MKNTSLKAMSVSVDKKQIPGRFQAGQSGESSRTQTGILESCTMAAQALIDGEVDALTRKAVDLALEGNMAALKLCLERLCPPKKERPLSVNLPAIEEVSALPKLTSALLTAVGKGELTAGEVGALSALVSSHGKALEMADAGKPEKEKKYSFTDMLVEMWNQVESQREAKKEVTCLPAS
jgi:hypothetical protein